MRDVLFSRALWITAVLLAGMLGNSAWRTIEGQSKLRAAHLDEPGPSEDIAVTLAVQPEQFHMSRLQAWGTMAGAEGRMVRLRGVTPAHLAQIASRSWVEAVQRQAAP